jgi:transposase-like protein
MNIISEFSKFSELEKTFSDESICIRHLEDIRWNHDVISPFDETSKVYKCKEERYRCRNTGKYFNVKTNTIFHNSKVELSKWFAAIWLFSNEGKITSAELSKQLGVTQKTAWLMQKRILKYVEQQEIAKAKNKKATQMSLTDWLIQFSNS